MVNNKELEVYFNILCNGDYPYFIDKYINTKELQRLQGISEFCGCDYIESNNIKYWYSKLDHSKAVALMTWHFTHDKEKTLIALFHELGTPVFGDCMNHLDSDEFNSNNFDVYNFIDRSKYIKKYLEEDNIDKNIFKNSDEQNNFENNQQELKLDNLDDILTTCLISKQYWDLMDIKEIYDDIIMLKKDSNEYELCFKHQDNAEYFFEGAYKYSNYKYGNEEKFIVKYVAKVLEDLIKNKNLTYEDLYTLNEPDIIMLIQMKYHSFRSFEQLEYMKMLNKQITNDTFLYPKSKQKNIIPLCINGNKIERLSTFSKKCQIQLDDYKSLLDKKTLYKKVSKN